MELNEILENAFGHHQRGELNEALGLYYQVLELAPEHSQALNLAGVAHAGLGEDEAAIAKLEKATHLYPDYAEAFANLGIALHGRHRYTEAAAAQRRATELDPSFCSAPRSLGEAANESVDRAMVLEPGNTHALSCKTISLHELGRSEEFDFLTDFDLLVQSIKPPVPEGYDSIEDFNKVLGDYARQHPSLWRGRRKGITSELLLDPEGPVVTLRDMIHRAFEEYIAALPTDLSHPFIDRRPAKFVISGCANVLDSGTDSHVHPNAWMSGAYYVQTSQVIESGDNTQGGCVEIGPPMKKHCQTENYPRRVFTPKEGHMVVFPSYVWHRVLPFTDRGERISYAFDVCPVG